jgi:hypothetical protein
MKLRLLVPALLLAMTFAACEDDPILTPQESKGAAGGSYSRINPSAPSDSVRIGVDRREIRNPKTF